MDAGSLLRLWVLATFALFILLCVCMWPMPSKSELFTPAGQLQHASSAVFRSLPQRALPQYPNVLDASVKPFRPRLSLRGTEDPNREPDSSPHGISSYDLFAIALIGGGVALVLQSTLAGEGGSWVLGASAAGLGGLLALMRPSSLPAKKPSGDPVRRLPSISPVTPDEWRGQYENPDGTVSLWVEDSFNVSTRGTPNGLGTGEAKSRGQVPVHHVQLTDREGRKWDFQVPEDRYVLWEAEDQGLSLPFACRNGCCTTCAVKVEKGSMVQDQALGVAPEFRAQGYGLMCVAFPKSDLVMSLVNEDELYDKQFGESFARAATDPKAATVKRDDYALEIALGDE